MSTYYQIKSDEGPALFFLNSEGALFRVDDAFWAYPGTKDSREMEDLLNELLIEALKNG